MHLICFNFTSRKLPVVGARNRGITDIANGSKTASNRSQGDPPPVEGTIGQLNERGRLYPSQSEPDRSLAPMTDPGGPPTAPLFTDYSEN